MRLQSRLWQRSKMRPLQIEMILEGLGSQLLQKNQEVCNNIVEAEACNDTPIPFSRFRKSTIDGMWQRHRSINQVFNVGSHECCTVESSGPSGSPPGHTQYKNTNKPISIGTTSRKISVCVCSCVLHRRSEKRRAFRSQSCTVDRKNDEPSGRS